jgi:hypothetical protein
LVYTQLYSKGCMYFYAFTPQSSLMCCFFIFSLFFLLVILPVFPLLPFFLFVFFHVAAAPFSARGRPVVGVPRQFGSFYRAEVSAPRQTPGQGIYSSLAQTLSSVGGPTNSYYPAGIAFHYCFPFTLCNLTFLFM